MTRDQIIIVTQKEDPHADDVIIAMERMGHDTVRINTDEIPRDVSISMRWEHDRPFEATIDVLTSGRTMSAGSVRSVWWRRPASFALPSGLSIRETEFATQELDHALWSLWSSLDCYWVSEPARIRQASWKGEQLARAARLGFEVPRTLVTTDPDAARQFFAACGNQMIFKVMSDPTLGALSLSRQDPELRLEQYDIMTTVLTEAELDLLDSVLIAPCLFQEYVAKKVELRVTVIGDEVFAAEIHSQEHEETSVDWRNSRVDIPYRAVSLPPLVTDRIRAFVRSYGLNFSAIDMIVTPDDRYVFIENNPNGQFIFVEDKVPELGLTDALAACLIRGASEPAANATAR